MPILKRSQYIEDEVILPNSFCVTNITITKLKKYKIKKKKKKLQTQIPETIHAKPSTNYLENQIKQYIKGSYSVKNLDSSIWFKNGSTNSNSPSFLFLFYAISVIHGPQILNGKF